MLSKIDHQTFKLKIDTQIDLELKDVIVFVDTFKHQQKGKFKLLIDLQHGYLNMSKEAFNYLHTHSVFNELEKLVFILITLPNRILVRFWIKHIKLPCKIEVFESYKKGLAWIKA